MTDPPAISIIIPYGYFTNDLKHTLRSIFSVHSPIEVLIVTNADLRKDLADIPSENIQIVESNEKGRGQFCAIGAMTAKAAVLLFLHADTTLPREWDLKIMKAMADPRVAGGGFSTSFRSSHWLIKRLSSLYSLFAQAIREFWGDRAIFMRRKDLISDIELIKIPIMEDVEMSKIIRRNGKLILLPEEVTTSAHHFNIKGSLRHIAEVIFYRLLYAFGVSADRIYRWYYRKHE